MALFSKEPTPAPRPEVRSSTPAPSGGTFVGPNVTIEGTLSGSEPIVIEGTVRGKINLSADLRVGTKARVEATVHARNVTVEGKLTGDVSADDRVELVSSATVDGNIKAPKIIVAEGAKFRGSVDMGSRVPKDDAAAPPAKAK
ncbi:MAG TPA: polymer-forming cytoskeletal protein [Thermoanaerobaculia bacterium]|jgi:cytoskeletal protein CcmA (bactofilin family)|nr:polymer-forming cytoskeletal protein [Thermoanaerobaculia bacterium]